jgi:hypothetical protein
MADAAFKATTMETALAATTASLKQSLALLKKTDAGMPPSFTNSSMSSLGHEGEDLIFGSRTPSSVGPSGHVGLVVVLLFLQGETVTKCTPSVC